MNNHLSKGSFRPDLTLNDYQVNMARAPIPGPAYNHAIAGLLSHADHAREGDIISIGLPMMLKPCGTPVYDKRFPIPDVLIQRNGRAALSADDHMGPLQSSRLMGLLRMARKDISLFPHAVDGCLRLGDQMRTAGIVRPEDHVGFITGLCDDCTVTLCWTHDFRHMEVGHSIITYSNSELSKLKAKIRLRIQQSGITRNILLGIRGLHSHRL